MKIGGLQKLTLLDYPGQIACIVFTRGCNFRCPFCQNAGLVVPERDDGYEVDKEEVFSYLEKRRGMLEGVVVTGGEPLIWPELDRFLARVKGLGYRVKLDTNGSFPEHLRKLLDQKLLDYVAMDIKQAPERYGAACGLPGQEIARKADRSLRLLRASGIPFELRTTLVRGIHRPEDVTAMAEWIAGPEPYYLQSYVDSGQILAPEGLSAFSEEELRELTALAGKFCPAAVLRR